MKLLNISQFSTSPSHSKYRMKTCRECGKVIGHMVCVKGHLCAVCKSATVEGVPRPSSSTSGSGCADPTVPTVEPQEPVKCDCTICQIKTLTPEPHSSSVEPPLPPPTPSSPSSQPPLPIHIRLSSPPSSLKLHTLSPRPSTPKNLNPTTSSGFLTPSHLQTPRLSQEPDTVSPVLSMLVEPPTPSSSLLSPSLSLALSSPILSTNPCTPIVILDQVPAPAPSNPHPMSSVSSDISPVQPIAQSLSDVENSRVLKKPVSPAPQGHNISPPSSNGSLVSLASLGLRDRHLSPASINSTFHSSSRQDSPPLSSPSSPVCSYFNYVDVDDYFDLVCHEEVEVNKATGEGGNSSSKFTLSSPDSTHQTVRKNPKCADSPAARTAVTPFTVSKPPSHTSKLYHNHRLTTPSQDVTTKLKENSSNIDGTWAHTNSFTVHIPLHIFPRGWRKQLRKKRRNNRKVVQFLKERGLRQKYPSIILTRVCQSCSFRSSVTSPL